MAECVLELEEKMTTVAIERPISFAVTMLAFDRVQSRSIVAGYMNGAGQ